MKSPKEKDASIIGRDADPSSERPSSKGPEEKCDIRGKLRRGELVIEFEREDPEDTLH